MTFEERKPKYTKKVNVMENGFKKMKIWLENCAASWEGGWDARIRIKDVMRMVESIEMEEKIISDAIVNVFEKDFKKDKP